MRLIRRIARALHGSKDDDHHDKYYTHTPSLPLRDIIVFPHMVVPLFVGREKSIQSLEEAMAGGKDVVLAAQRMAKTTIRARGHFLRRNDWDHHPALATTRWHRQGSDRR